jgi:hypothetical protein
MRVFLDSNVVLDVALKRAPHMRASGMVLLEAKAHGHVLLFSASSATDIYYILRRIVAPVIARRFLTDLITIAGVCPVDGNIIAKALASEFSDVEDAVQYFSAVSERAEVIVTRNKADFAYSTLEVLSPDEFCAKYLPADSDRT